MKQDDHVCVVWCILYPMTCSPSHTQMLQSKAAQRSYPRAQPERKFEKERSKKPSRSTTRLANKVTNRLPGANQVPPVTRGQPRTASPDTSTKEGP